MSSRFPTIVSPSITGRIRSPDQSGQLTKYIHILHLSVFDCTNASCTTRACVFVPRYQREQRALYSSIMFTCLRTSILYDTFSTRFMHDLGLYPGCVLVRTGGEGFRVHCSLLAGQRATQRERGREREDRGKRHGEQVHRPEARRRGKLLIFVYLLSRLMSRGSAANATPSLGTTGTPCIRRQWP